MEIENIEYEATLKGLNTLKGFYYFISIELFSLIFIVDVSEKDFNSHNDLH